MSNKKSTRADLDAKVALLQKQVVYLQAILYRNTKVLALLEYNRSTAGWGSAPSANGITRKDGTTGVSNRGVSPIDARTPTLDEMANYNLVDHPTL
jgi:hypothetical protein